MLREPVRRDRIVTILPSGKVGRELVKKRAPPGEANCVVVRHTASDGSKGLHLRAIATMAPARPRYGGRWLPRRAFPEVGTMANVEVDYWLDHERATGFD
mgnify:CR=1 FL=1